MEASKLAVERDADPQVQAAANEGDREAAAISGDREARDPSFAPVSDKQPPQLQGEGVEVPPGEGPGEK